MNTTYCSADRTVAVKRAGSVCQGERSVREEIVPVGDAAGGERREPGAFEPLPVRVHERSPRVLRARPCRIAALPHVTTSRRSRSAFLDPAAAAAVRSSMGIGCHPWPEQSIGGTGGLEAAGKRPGQEPFCARTHENERDRRAASRTGADGSLGTQRVGYQQNLKSVASPWSS